MGVIIVNPIFDKLTANKRKLAFVLGGGGALGMMQVGALQALMEADIRPDLWVGTSIGAVNATFLAIHGFTPEGMAGLDEAWDDAIRSDMLPSSYLWLSARILFNRVGIKPYHHRMRDFYVRNGVDPDLRFGDLGETRLRLIATDLTGHGVMVYGTDPHHSVLDGLLASSAIPPWVRPLEIDGRMFTDGGAVSDVPVEPALNNGATEIIAMRLESTQHLTAEAAGFGPFFNRLVETIYEREFSLEMALAQAKQIPVHLLELKADPSYTAWDFSHIKPLRDIGYRAVKEKLADWQLSTSVPKPWYATLMDFIHRQYNGSV